MRNEFPSEFKRDVVMAVRRCDLTVAEVDGDSDISGLPRDRPILSLVPCEGVALLPARGAIDAVSPNDAGATSNVSIVAHCDWPR